MKNRQRHQMMTVICVETKWMKESQETEKNNDESK